MLKKIISGGQVGADQAALDAAIKCNFPHGGWIQKGRKTQTGVLPEKYHLIEMPAAGYKERIEQNVVQSDGTVIVSHGDLSGGADYSWKMAMKHHRPCLHIDLSQTPASVSSAEINTWIIENSIKVLNVTGSRASEDGDVYKETAGIIEATILLSLVEAKPGENLTDHSREEYLEKAPIPPKTVDEAVDRLLSILESREMLKIANIRLDDGVGFDADLHQYFKNVLNVWHGNKDLLADCRSVSGRPIRSENEAEFVIIKTLQERLKQTHALRVVK